MSVLITRGYSFTIDAGMTAPKGKPRWPNSLRLRMQKDRAIEFARELLAQVQNRDDGCEIELWLPGEIQREVEDDLT